MTATIAMPATQPFAIGRPSSWQCRTVTVDLAGDAGLSLTQELSDAILIPRSTLFRAYRNGDLAAQQFDTPDDASDSPLCIRIILPGRDSKFLTEVIAWCLSIAANPRVVHVTLISDASVHFGDQRLRKIEQSVAARFKAVARPTLVLRLGRQLAKDDHTTWLRRLAPWSALVPARLQDAFVEPLEVLAALETLEATQARGCRTLLGSRRQMREVMQSLTRPCLKHHMARFLSILLKCVGVGLLITLVVAVLVRLSVRFRQMTTDTLEPDSVEELLSLYWPANLRHVALAGFNSGVNHFGWRYPGRTVVRTTSSGTRLQIRGDRLVVDSGVLLKRGIDELRRCGREFFVIPNYSYVSMGTIFMVPVHGSGSDVSTLGETIEAALLYDPQLDRIIRVRRGSREFGRYMYHPASRALVLRLTIRVRGRSHFTVRKSELPARDVDAILETFADPDADNIEIRKADSKSPSVEVAKYYRTTDLESGTLEQARDSIGSLWDRIEETPVLNSLFHTFVRKCGYHVELFLTFDEFRVFWAAHHRLRLLKIQLRFVHRDGLPHSPAGDADRISVDIFMKRKKRQPFLDFMQEHLPDARHNPGKNSM